MTPDEYQRALTYLRDIWKNWQCPVDRTDKWTLFDKIASAPTWGGGNAYPFLVAMCDECGLTILFNAIKAGVVQRPTPHP